MNSISNLIMQSGKYEGYIQQLVQLESQQKYELQSQKRSKNDQQSALGEISSVISEFESKIEEIQDPGNNALTPLKASTSDDSVVQVDSTSGLDNPSSYDITVQRLADNDTMLTGVIDGTASDIAGFGDGSVDITIGDKTETITVSSTKTDSGGNTVDKTNEEILQSFSDKINDLLGEEAEASVFQTDNDGNVQFSIKSQETGYDERIQFSNASGALAEVTGNMTHDTAVADLDAKFKIDGVTFTRGQNTVDDAISGMTFTLLDDTGNQEQITIEKDLEKAKENVEGFMNAFNKLNSKIRSKTFIDESGNRGILREMRSVRGLSTDLRQTALKDMSGAADGELQNLTEIGISFENDGEMVIEDSDLLEEMLTERPDEVSKLFTDDTSVVSSMKTQAEAYTKSNGIISTLEDGIDQNIEFLENRIESENEYLQKYEERQRTIFAELEQIQQKGQFQYNQVTRIQTQLGL
ncbi:flagellar filament capping protein FliD [Aliifodinibius sp. S!AR15-10]|uniref:flagellar filament capping protein FliD n=1 Tax=Aliifodinibius sp. S!AR15-10 TaxID=2950437 RepID=UPI002862CFCE|nr:flagellar filament capping protein FliD [Aliifodinibius sp. S!AR15-10]MDR8393026.1 flagellar filament capping protein FliD [Aliifodinibius sp. S!AR15-10]